MNHLRALARPLLLLVLGATEEPLRHGQPSFTTVTPVLYAADIRKTVDFYRDVLGFGVSGFTIGAAKSVTVLKDSDTPYGAVLTVGHQVIQLQLASAVHADGSRLSIGVRDLSAFHHRVSAFGVPIGKLVPIVQGGVLCFSVTDPDGHEILFLQASASAP